MPENLVVMHVAWYSITHRPVGLQEMNHLLLQMSSLKLKTWSLEGGGSGEGLGNYYQRKVVFSISRGKD